MLAAQTASQVLLGMSTLVLGGYSAFVQNVISIIRNLIAIGRKSTKPVEYILIGLGVVLGIAFNNLGVIGWLPIVANLEYSVAIFKFRENEYLLKIAFAVCVSMYIAFNLFISNYVGAASNFVVLTTALIALVKSRKAQNKQ